MLPLRLFTFLVVALCASAAAEPADKWEAEIAQLEARDRAHPPRIGGTVFAGSSSIRLWDLKKSFPDLDAVNVGFGGSTIADCTRYAPRLILPWKPNRIVFYSGDNDLFSGLAPEKVAADFKTFAATIHAALPACRIVVIGIKPSQSRWKLWPKAIEANRLIRAHCEADEKKRLHFVDIAPTLLGPDGHPRPELFRDDRLHLNDAGYEAWTKALEPILRG
ncbi:MAG: GDSL-type esterase/lipase family protein [Verrucomicrobiales bacterium]